MKKEFRIKKHQDFDQIIKHGLKTKTEHFLLYSQASELPTYRIGIAIGKANGNAVKRVRQKRQVRAMIAAYPPKANKDYIVIIRPNFDSSKFEEMKDEWKRALTENEESQH